MMQNSNRRKQSGVASIEFAIGFIFFWLMCAAWVQMSFMSYVSAIGDLAISQAALHSKKIAKNDNFLDDFRNTLKKSDSLWRYVVDAEDFNYSINYIKDYRQLLGVIDACKVAKDDRNKVNSITCGDARNSAIAIYRIEYNSPAIFDYFFDSDTLFTREAIVIQEYQREKFRIR